MSGRLRVAVAGAGVFGLASALALLKAGAEVAILDPAQGSQSASAAAAGLLGPVGEAILDQNAAPHYPVLCDALGLWAGFSTENDIALSNAGLVMPTDLAGAVSALGVRTEPHPLGVFVRADPRVVDPPAALEALRCRAKALGARLERRVVSAEDWDRSDLVVLAPGAGTPSGPVAPELARLSPVKGQIAVLPEGPKDGPTIRWPGGYLAPQPGGARVGATMEPGRRDTTVDPDAIARLVGAALERVPGLRAGGAFGMAGIRMQTADGLPLVGPSAAPRTLLAAGARRNGWLLAPLVGRMIAAYAMRAGEGAGPWAEALHPARFDPA
jgi:glycine oxidase